MKSKTCVSCAGTGWWYLDRSWFPADGYRRVHCHICKGSGESAYRDDPEWCRQQAKKRERVAR